MKKNSFKITAALLLSLMLAVVACDKNDDDDDAAVVTGNIVITENISVDTKWEAGKVYELGGRITVLSGATLTIEAGTIIKGQAGTGANATALLVARGAKLMAEGTDKAPIIFTSLADEISPADVAAGKFASPNLDPDIDGLWGGVLILGKAPISVSGDAKEVQIEGIPTSDQNGLYGGTDAADNSGVIKYISIRHGGANIGSGNEINGLTLGAVGSGTVVENIEVIANQDDGIEWFGGTVNVKNVVILNVNDDAIDTDQAWSGTLENFVVITPGDHCFELDGPEGSMKGGHTIKNGTVVSVSSDESRVSVDLLNVDANSIVTLKDIHYVNPTTGQKINRVTAAEVVFDNITMNVAADKLAEHVNGTVPASVKTGNTAKTDVSKLTWTWAHQAGLLSF